MSRSAAWSPSCSAGSPGTTRTVAPWASTRPASSVASAPAGVGPAQHVGPEGLGRLDRHQARRGSTVAHTVPSSTRFTVSATARAGTAPSAPARTASTTDRNSAGAGQRAGAVVDHDHLGARGHGGQAGRHRGRPGGAAGHHQVGTVAVGPVGRSPVGGSTRTTPSATERAAATDQSTTGRPPSSANCLGRRSDCRRRRPPPPPTPSRAHSWRRRPARLGRIRAAPRRGASRPPLRRRRGRR